MRLSLLLLLLLCLCRAQAASVVFISPGHADELYWVGAVQAMQQAARDLQLELRVLHAERDPLRQVSLVRELAAGPHPDYLMVAADKGVLVEQLRLADAAGIPTLVVYNSVQPAEREALGRPRAGLRHWLGSLAPRAEDAGYLTGRALIEAGLRQGLGGAGGELQLLVLLGDRSSDTSIRRFQGLQRALSEFPQVQLRQSVASDWRRDKAHLQARHLLRRYPQVQLIWAGSDQIALGAMQAAEEEGRRPGQDLLFAGVNTSREAMQARVEGRLSALAGGHYMAGAWGLVLLHDHAAGQDFAASEGLELERPMFSLFSARQARRYLAEGEREIDFRRFSKVHNPGLARYDFSYAALLRGRP